MRSILLTLAILSPITVFPQKFANNQDKFKLPISPTTEQIVIDGRFNEEIWSQIDPARDFINQWPVDSGRALVQTEVRLTYDNNFLYVAATCFDVSNRHIIQTLKRDSPDEYFGSDGIAIVLDPINTKSSGFFFGVNAGGAQMEGLIQIEGIETVIDESWDNKWYSEISSDGNTWYVEMAIPFSTLRYNKENKVWGLNFVRNDMKNNYFTSWAQVPVNLNTIDLGYNGALVWEGELPTTKGKNIALIPYLATGVTKDYEANEPANGTFDVGMDAKVAITQALNLDLTINPDFSNVEVDVQQTNLSRFSLFFPERRDFFLENSDLFGSFGLSNITPFFSRSIGLNNGNLIPIKYGARLTGNLTDNLRIGVMDVQTGESDGLATQNYLVGALQQQIGKRSTFKGLFVNRQRTGSGAETGSEYNRVAAAEVNLLSPNGKLGTELGMHKSFNPTHFPNENLYKLALRYNSKRIFSRLSNYIIGENYITDAGFVPRLYNYDAENDTVVRRGYSQHNYLLVHNTFPESESINLHGSRFSGTFFLNADGSLNERFNGFFYFFAFANQSALEVSYRNQEVNLPFLTPLVGNTPLPAANYKFGEYGFWYRTNPRRKISGQIGMNKGTFYNGKRFRVNGSINYRIQPWGNFSIDYNYNDISMPEGFDSASLHLIGLKAEISFSNRLFWTSFFQYNTQIQNFNINSRLQWRFRPMSDLFIVYSDNYTTDNLAIKNRGLVVKINYWL